MCTLHTESLSGGASRATVPVDLCRADRVTNSPVPSTPGSSSADQVPSRARWIGGKTFYNWSIQAPNSRELTLIIEMRRPNI
jgi:hypothetical protein